MKTAKQVRDLMKPGKRVDRICNLLEQDIVSYAKNGHCGVQVFLGYDKCPPELKDSVVKELIKNGFEAEASLVGDKCVFFVIKW